MTVKKTKARPQLVATPLEPNENQPLLLDDGSVRDHLEDLEALHQTSSRANQPILEAPDEATWTPPAGFAWMEMAIMTNVFLYGFDGTITASTYAVISSEFGAANKASWLTTSYLITSAAFQPLAAMQNGIVGFGAICGAAFGGSIADTIGWRWCFVAQVPCAMVALVFGAKVLTDPPGIVSSVNDGLDLVWKRLDFRGAVLLVSAISLQLLGLSLGGNELPWSSPWVIGLVATSIVLLGLFLHVEATTSAMPIVPLRLFQGTLPVLVQTANLLAGAAAYAYLFMLPLFFQAVLLETAAKAGARLAIPSLAGPLGGLVAGIVMSRWGKLVPLVRVGACFMLLGNTLTATLAFSDSSWKYFAYIFPANFGQGIIYPAILFTSLASFEHADDAVSASTVYLVRSLGTMWGVSITSAILQTTLSIRLPEALGHVPNKWKIIKDIRHSVDALHNLPPDIRLKVQHVYYDGIRYSVMASASATVLVLIAALLASSTALRKTH
ncbi:hypothetical protein G3M48_003946 [Beauveria asiatica]|uniref:Major facilitator superfamily (MFS) profile domain-containing protein n=1 Tax=Beauveria asiatica TaxID=1069075 RepID=A0AAW0RV60_9HYPO